MSHKTKYGWEFVLCSEAEINRRKVENEECYIMNEKIARVGSLIVTITVAVFAVCMLIDFNFGSFFICMILPIGFIMMTSGFYDECESSKKVAAMNGVIFCGYLCNNDCNSLFCTDNKCQIGDVNPAGIANP